MTNWTPLTVASLALAAALAAGCVHRPPEPAHVEDARPQVDLRMVGLAEAVLIRQDTPLVTGPGAEGRPGDWLLVNACARFVVGGEGRVEPSPLYAGALLDAALHGEEDYLRALAPHAGSWGAAFPGPLQALGILMKAFGGGCLVQGVEEKKTTGKQQDGYNFHRQYP